MSSGTLDPAKAAAVEQWNADPCGPAVEASVGTAGYFEQLDAGRRAYAPWMDEMLDYVGANGLAVLDIGCGQGIDLVRYARVGARVTGIDLTPKHVVLARRQLDTFKLNGTVVEGDAEKLPFSDHSFDIASSNGVLHHTPDMPAALREARRVLRPGGRFTVIVYNRQSIHYWLHQFLFHGLVTGKLLREGNMAGVLSANVERTSIGARPLVRVYSPREVRAMLAQAGFANVAIAVRHLRYFDSYFTRPLKSFPGATEGLSRRLGWYVIARAVVPAKEHR